MRLTLAASAMLTGPRLFVGAAGGHGDPTISMGGEERRHVGGGPRRVDWNRRGLPGAHVDIGEDLVAPAAASVILARAGFREDRSVR